MENSRTKRPLAIESVSIRPVTPAAKKSSYKYTPLNEVAAGQTQNLYGFVADCSCPTTTKGSDMKFLIRVADDRGNSVVVRLFESKQEDFPVPICVGDIVRFHRIKFVSINGNVEGGVNLMKKNGIRTSMLLIKIKDDGQDVSTWESLSFPSSNYTWDEDEDVKQVQSFVKPRLMSITTMRFGDRSFTRTFSALEPKNGFDIVCKIHSFEVGAVDLVQTVIATDGTEPPESYRLQSNELIPPEAIQIQFSGQLNRIYVTKYLMAISVPIWVRLRNVMSSSSVVFFGDSSSMVFMHPNHKDVEILQSSTLRTPSLRNQLESEPCGAQQQAAEKIQQTDRDSIPFINNPHHTESLEGLLTVIPHKEHRHTGILEIMSSKMIPNKYVVQVFVRDIYPKDVADFIRLICKHCKKTQKVADQPDYSTLVLCPVCSTPTIFELAFMFQLKIEDETGSTQVLVHGEHAMNFLNGATPAQVFQNVELQQKLRASLQRLTSSRKQYLCIFSYRHVSIASMTMLQLFDTKLSL